MSYRPPDGEIRRSQILTAGGPGALVDLIGAAVIIKGLDAWRYQPDDEGFFEAPRLYPRVFKFLKGTSHWKHNHVRFRRPPECDDDNPHGVRGIHAREFPAWYLCQRCNSLVQRHPGLDDKRKHTCFQNPEPGSKPFPAVPIRFVSACQNGHIHDIDWRYFVHQGAPKLADGEPWRCEVDPSLGLMTRADGRHTYQADLQLRTEGTTGELNDLMLTCRRCGMRRGLQDLSDQGALGRCHGWRPWLKHNDPKPCTEQVRLQIRTGTNAWFPLTLSALAIPESDADFKEIIDQHFDLLKRFDSAEKLRMGLQLNLFTPEEAAALKNLDLGQLVEAVRRRQQGNEEAPDIREAEWATLMVAPEGAPGDLPGRDEEWCAHRLPTTDLPAFLDRVVLVKALTETRAQVGFLRREGFPVNAEGVPDVDPDRVSPLAEEADWVPAVEIRGEGVFIALREEAVREWEAREAVQKRKEQFEQAALMESERKKKTILPMEPRLIMLHSLAHMLIRAISLECGYSAAAIRERIYCFRAVVADDATDEERQAAYDRSRAGILLYTGTPGSEGTLGGLVEVGAHIVDHLRRAVDMNTLCSNDPICAQHTPDGKEEGRRREGAACHGCLLIAEPSCERMNQDLDRALVVPTVAEGSEEMAFLGDWRG